MNTITNGPVFQVESNEAILLMGNSERKSTGQFLADTLVDQGVFDDIFIFTANESDTWAGRKALRSGLKTKTGLSHSIGAKYLLDALEETGDTALQVVAFNAPEPTKILKQIWLASTKVTGEKIDKETGAEHTGNKAAWEALKEMTTGFSTTRKTMSSIARGFSGTQRLIDAARANVFSAGQVMVHSEHDAFGFAQMADLGRAASAGVTTVMLSDHFHNEVLYAPGRTIDRLTPAVFPARVE
jgi:hypothetical protein